MLKAQDHGNYFRIPADTRNLNYEQYFSKGEDVTEIEDYHSHNTKRLDVEGTKALLMKLKEIKNDVK